MIGDIPKPPNRRRGEHWSKTSKYAKYWKALVRASFDNGHKPQTRRCKVTISQMRKRLLDRDNLFSSCKPITDALTFWKLIKDDSEKWIDLDCRQVVGKEKITIVIIEEL
jgi:hypothetical protein